MVTVLCIIVARTRRQKDHTHVKQDLYVLQLDKLDLWHRPHIVTTPGLPYIIKVL